MSCPGQVMSGFVYIAKTIVYLIWIMGPIIAIVSLSYNLALLMKNPDNKKLPKKVKNSVIALILLFFIPTLVFLTVSLTDNDFSACWKSAKVRFSLSTTYEDPSGNKNNNKSIYTKQDEYQTGKKNTNSNTGSYGDASVTVSGNCRQLPNCSKYITSLVNNSLKFNDALLQNNGSVYYAQDTPQSWQQAINIAKSGGTVHISCNRPSHWSMRDITGEYRDFYSWELGGFENYGGPMTKYTRQYKFDGSMSVKNAIKKGVIQTGDIVGTRHHTFSIYSVNTSDGSAVVFDGGHRFTDKCQERRKCSTMFTYDAGTTGSLDLYQLIRWTS